MFRGRLANANALPQMVLLGVAVGIVTAGVILLFRLLVEQGGAALLGLEDIEHMESLSIGWRFVVCLAGAALLAVLLRRYSPSARRVGVVHVMERLSRHQGYLPLRNAVIQFFGAAIALISGQSGGCEGPAIHLGATAASLMGQQFHLPNNSIRTMVACGTAAAIASSFNTPIAGVIFAMEVVMMEYTVSSFMPVIVAAVCSTLITQMVFGNAPAFTVTEVAMNSYMELSYLLLAGLFIGSLAAGYNQLIQRFARYSERPFWIRMLAAGCLTAAFAAFLPQVMGVGYDTVNAIMQDQMPLVVVALLLMAKMLTSAATVGLGMPVGLIGPTMFIGACFGGAFGAVLSQLHGPEISVGFYVILGMCAMMAAVLQAPLAALMAVLELTANTTIILPAMVIIVVATMVCSHVFKQRSVYIATLNTLGLQYPPNPVTLHLQRMGATAVMDRSFARVAPVISQAEAQALVASAPNWILVDNTEQSAVRAALNPSDLAAFLDDRGATEEEIYLLELPGQRLDVTSVDTQATLFEVQKALEDAQAEACCVHRTTAPLIKPVVGIVTRSHLENYRNVLE